MSVLKFTSKPNAAASAKNVQYISRDKACDLLSFHNLPELETADRQGNKTNAIAYAEERMEQEVDKRGDRNHYRIIITFDRDVPSGEADRAVHEYLKENFPNQAAIVAIHQEKQKPEADKEKIRDSKHTHAHVWMDCRNLETGRKLNIEKEKFRTLDERWMERYDRQYGTDYNKEFTEKKRETAEWKREYAFAKKHNQPLPPKPERVADNYRSKQYRQKDLRDRGVKPHEERTADRDQRFITVGRAGIDQTDNTIEISKQEFEHSKQGFERSKRTLRERANSSERAERTAEHAVQEMDGLYNAIERLPEQRTRNRNIDRSDSRGR
jgi:hypothetical protein